MKIYTKESLIKELRSIRERGWIVSGRHGNDGAVGNTLEDLRGTHGVAGNDIRITRRLHGRLAVRLGIELKGELK